MERETIFAVASGAGRASVAVMRISGPTSGATLDRLCGKRPPPRRASLRTLRGADGDVLDRGLVLWFPAPGSYTGEDTAELHLHGSQGVLNAVAETLRAAGLRIADPGEFTRRAFLNGRMDLLEAEGVADLVEAETGTQRRQALRQMEGALGALYRGWSGKVREILAEQEAMIDFSDDEVPAPERGRVIDDAAAVAAALAAHLDDSGCGERIRDGLVFAVVGAPNVGKSSLVNALAGRDVAIVSSTSGTTRDPLEARLELGGMPVTLVDTAGLREGGDEIEMEGIRRARGRAEDADLIIEVIDDMRRDMAYPTALVVANKIDLAPPASPNAIGVSTVTGAGLPDLRRILGEAARKTVAQDGSPPLTRTRHRLHLESALTELRDVSDTALAELRAEHLRRALHALGGLTGEITSEDILDTIFSRFCIGK